MKRMDDSQIRSAAGQIADLCWELYHGHKFAFEEARPADWRELRDQIVKILLAERDHHYIYM